MRIMKEKKVKNVKKATNGKARALLEERKKRAKKKKEVKKLKISDIKRGEGAEVSHLLARIKAREVELTFCCVAICLVVICVSLYFVFSAVRDPKDYNTMTVGDFSVSFNTVGESLGNIINLTPLTPISDAQGQETTSYGVHIENSSEERQSFQIVLESDSSMIEEDGCSDRQLDNQYLHYQIEDSNVFPLVDTTDSSPVLFSSYLEPGEKKTYQIRIWVADTVPVEYLDYHYHGKLVVQSEKTVNN